MTLNFSISISMQPTISTTSKTLCLHLLVTQMSNKSRSFFFFYQTLYIYNFTFNVFLGFSGMALHPLDGILQAAPHVVALFIVPIHLKTHLSLLFLEGIWTASIHDCIHGNIWPIMGAGYHTIHHTTYKHNYGHYTIWMDWIFGSLKVPLAEQDNFKEKSNVRNGNVQSFTFFFHVMSS